MPKLIINNREIEVPAGITLIQACELAGVEIPRFCYHERLSIAGNCRMCLVEVAGMPKPVASCAMSVGDLRPGRDGTPPMIITDSPTVKTRARGRARVPAHQPPARLPDLRPGRGMRFAGPDHGLRLRRRPLPGQQTRGGGQISRASDRHLHDALHPLHALCALHDRGRRRGRPRRHRPRRGYGDHHLSGAGHTVEPLGQRGRSLPGRRAHLQALRLQRAALGADQDALDRHDGRARQRHPRRCARARGHAHPAPRQRRHQRGVDLGQGAPCVGRLAHPAARPPLCQAERHAREGHLERGVRHHRRQAQGARRRALRRDRRRPRRRRGDVRAEAAKRAARLAQYRLPPGRRGARSGARARHLPVQLDHRRHRQGRRDPAYRDRSAPRSAGLECPHPQARASDSRQAPRRR